MGPRLYFAFELGWGRLFNISFRIGEPANTPIKNSDPSSSESQHYPIVKSGHISATPSTIQSPLPDPGIAVEDCLLFIMLPIEIRRLIYKHLLVSTEMISKAHNLISWSQSPLLNDCIRIHDIDAIFLRTCRKIYNETMPVLYGENTFIFERADEVTAFRDHGRLGGTFLTCRSIFTLQSIIDASSQEITLESHLRTG